MIKDHFKIFILLIGLSVILFIIFQGTAGSYYRTIYESQVVNLYPAGEITSDFFLQQSINLAPGVENEEKITLFVFMATYIRNNYGNISFSLTQNDSNDIIILQAINIKDNSYQKLQFNSEGFREGSAILSIRGIDGNIGNAATVYLTEDVTYGRAVINGNETNRSLMIKYGVRANNPYFNIVGGELVFFIWVLTYVLVIIVFFVYCRNQND